MFFFIGVLFSAVILLFLEGCNLPLVGNKDEKKTSGQLKVILVDKGTKAPLVDAEVTLVPDGGKDTSDNKGEVTFLSVPPGTFSLIINKPGYVNKQQDSIVISDDSLASEKIEVSPAVSGLVILPEKPKKLFPGDTLSLKAEVSYNGGHTDSDAFWFTSDSGIAIVDENGNVTAISGGFVQITAKSKSDNNFSQINIITVLQISKITTPVASLKLWQNTTKHLTRTMVTYNDQSSDYNVRYGVLDSNIIEISESGDSITVDAKEMGQTSITATAVSDSSSTGHISVTVHGVESVKLSKDSVVLLPDEKLDLKATVYYSDGSVDENVIWESSNNAIITQDSLGSWRPVKPGAAHIQATSERDRSKSAICSVSVLGVINVTLNTGNLSLFRGDTATVSAVVQYTDSSVDENFKLVPTENDLIDISRWHSIKGLKAGKSVLTAIALRDSSKSASLEIEVVDMDSLSISDEFLLMEPGDSIQVNALAFYTNGTKSPMDIKWATKIKSIALVDSTGLITGVNQGETEISVQGPISPDLSKKILVRVVMPLKAYGSATIDGKLDSLEWKTAEVRSYPYTLMDSAGNTAMTMKLMMMNDLENLFLGIKLPTGDTLLKPKISIQFNNDGDNIEEEPGDDILVLDTTGYRDSYLGKKGDSIVTAADTLVQGTNDVSGAASLDSLNQSFELSHPLNSGDSLDFSLSIGSIIGFHIRAELIRNDSLVGTAGSPIPSFLDYLEILPEPK